jgi:hypothetical protein
VNTNNEGIQADSAWNGVVCNSLIIGMTGGEPSIEFAGSGLCPWICSSSGDSSLDGAAGTAAGNCDAVIAAGGLGLSAATAAGFPPGAGCFDILPIGAGAGSDNQFSTGPNTVIPAGYQFLVNENHYFHPHGFGTGRLLGSKLNDAGAAAAVPMDPRLASPADAQVSGGVEPLVPGFDSSETFRGAFRGSDGPLWIEGWTVMSAGGIVD